MWTVIQEIQTSDKIRIEQQDLPGAMLLHMLLAGASNAAKPGDQEYRSFTLVLIGWTHKSGWSQLLELVRKKKCGKHSKRLNSNILSSLLLTVCKITFKFYSAERTKQYMRTISALVFAQQLSEQERCLCFCKLTIWARWGFFWLKSHIVV